jgi:hypothetical protein
MIGHILGALKAIRVILRIGETAVDVAETLTDGIAGLPESARPTSLPPLPDRDGPAMPLSFKDVARQREQAASAARAFPGRALPPPPKRR